jgi:hypothetical protein
MRRAALALLIWALASAGASAQTVDLPPPTYHGVLEVGRASGSIERPSGVSSLHVPGWQFQLDPEQSNGIFPATEPVEVAVGPSATNKFALPAGSLKASRNGKRFTFRQKLHKGQAGIRMIQIALRPDGTYTVRFTVNGIVLDGLETQDPVCLPLAVIVGDDDGFQGVNFTSPTFTSHRLRIAGKCNATGDWPWLGG